MPSRRAKRRGCWKNRLRRSKTFMTLAEALRDATLRLQHAEIDDARLEAEVLLCHVRGVQRETLFAQLQEPISEAVRRAFHLLLARRIAHEPTAYITGHREFYGLDFACSPAALIPRPETELLVETAHDWIMNHERPVKDLRAIDVGTGSGAIAVALAKHIEDLRIIATDSSADALQLARRNAAAQRVSDRVEFVEGPLREPAGGTFDLILANLPYIPSRTYATLPPEIRDHEPATALRAGRRGTAVIEALLEQAAGRLSVHGLLLAEHGWNQGRQLRRTAADHFPTAEIETRRDLAGRARMLLIARIA